MLCLPLPCKRMCCLWIMYRKFLLPCVVWGLYDHFATHKHLTPKTRGRARVPQKTVFSITTPSTLTQRQHACQPFPIGVWRLLSLRKHLSWLLWNSDTCIFLEDKSSADTDFFRHLVITCSFPAICIFASAFLFIHTLQILSVYTFPQSTVNTVTKSNMGNCSCTYWKWQLQHLTTIGQ